MNLWFRLFHVLVMAWFRPRLAWDQVSRLTLRVWPLDLDINVHMNNARYMAIMDLGRVDIILRSGLGRLVWKRKLAPVIASAMIRYRRPLLPFQRFTLTTRLLGWDAKWLFIEHRIERDGELACHAVVKGTFLGAAGGVPPAELAAFLGHDQPSPPLPAWVADWLAAEAAQNQPAKIEPVSMPVEESTCVR